METCWKLHYFLALALTVALSLELLKQSNNNRSMQSQCGSAGLSMITVLSLLTFAKLQKGDGESEGDTAAGGLVTWNRLVITSICCLWVNTMETFDAQSQQQTLCWISEYLNQLLAGDVSFSVVMLLWACCVNSELTLIAVFPWPVELLHA